MSSGTTRTEEHALAIRLEHVDAQSNAAYARAKASLYPQSGSTARVIGDGTAIFTGVRSPVNRVHGLGMTAAVTSSMIDTAEVFFNARGLAAAIDLCPLAHASLLPELGRRAYAVAGFKHVFHRTLDALADLPPAASHIRIEQVAAGNANLWARVVAGAFAGQTDVDVDADALEVPLPNVIKEATVCYLAWVDDTPAGGAALAMHAGAAICYSTSVRPSLRRMGVQTALLTTRLRHACAAGCNLAVVQTTPDSASQRNVLRFGFQLAYTKPTVVQTRLPGHLSAG